MFRKHGNVIAACMMLILLGSRIAPLAADPLYEFPGSSLTDEEPALTEDSGADGAESGRRGYFAEQWPAVTSEEAPGFIEGLNESFKDETELRSERNLFAPEGSAADDPFYPCPSASEDGILAYFSEHFPAPKDRGIYGSSWAYAATGMAEIYMASHGMAGQDVDLSELHLLYWSYHNGSSPLQRFSTGDSILFTPISGIGSIMDAGGNLLHATQTLYQRGAASENVLPQSQSSYLSSGGAANAASERDICARLKTACRISTRHNTQQLKGAVVANGSAAVGVCTDSAFYNVSDNSYFCNESRAADQAVLILGWDDSFPREAFGADKPSVSGAWLVQNSRSNTLSAGRDSLYWVSYEDMSLTDAWTVEMTRDTYDNYYDTDSQIHGLGGYFNKARGYANIFPVCGNEGAGCEELKAVRFEMADVRAKGAKYTLRIYTDVYGDMPFQGTLSAEYRGKLYYAGNYTFKLPKSVTLRRGSRFSVVLVFDQIGSTVTLEKALSANGCLRMQVGSRAGQSYVSTDGMTFSDINGESNDHGNLVISAMTDDRTDLSHPGYMSIDPPSYTFTQPYDELVLNATVWDEELKPIDGAAVSWYSGNSEVAEVDDRGHVIALKNGSCFIYGRCEEIESHCIINVSVPFSERVYPPDADVDEGQSLPWNEEIHLRSFTEEAEIYYTLDGSEPDKNSERYNHGIPLNRSMCGKSICLRAIAYSEGKQDSEVMSVNFRVTQRGSIQLTAKPKNEILLCGEGNVMLSAVLFTDGTETLPTCGFHFRVQDPDILQLGKQEGGTIALIGLRNGETTVSVSACNILEEEVIASVNVIVNIPKTAGPIADIADGATLSVGDTISFRCDTPGARIFCTTDGSQPSLDSTECVSGCFVIGSEMAGKRITLRVSAVREGRLLFSDVTQLRIKIRRGEYPGHSAMDPVPQLTMVETEDGGSVSALFLVKGQKYDLSMQGLTTSDKKVVKLSKSGRLSAVGSGRAVIRRKGEEEVLLYVTVIQPQMNVKKLNLAVGESAKLDLLRQLKTKRSAALSDESSYDLEDLSKDYPDILWYSSNEEIATVTEGTVKAVSKGSCVIRAYINGKLLKTRITVKDGRSFGKLSDGDTVSLNALMSIQLKTKDFRLAGASWSGEGLQAVTGKNNKISYYENNVIRITAGGKLMATGCGSVTLKAVEKADPSKSFTLHVVVREPEDRTLYLTPKAVRKLSYYGVNKKAARWTVTGDEDVVQLSDTGKLTALAEGECLLCCSCDPYGTGGFCWYTHVNVSSPALKTDERLKLEGNGYRLVMKTDDPPYEAEWQKMLPQDTFWMSNKNAVAFVDEYGCIHARGKGKAVVRGMICGKTVKIQVTVE